ncbi:unnamed protein product, partial [Closterium sp. Naga37s-1]
MRGDDQLSHWLVEVVRPGGASASSSKSGRVGARGGIRDGAGEAAGLAVAVEEAKNERSGCVLLILVHVVAGCDTRGPSSHGAESPRGAAGQGQEQAAADAEAETEEALKWALLKPLQVAVQQHQVRALSQPGGPRFDRCRPPTSRAVSHLLELLAHAAVSRIVAVASPLLRSHPFSLSPHQLPSPSIPPLILRPCPWGRARTMRMMRGSMGALLHSRMPTLTLMLMGVTAVVLLLLQLKMVVVVAGRGSEVAHHNSTTTSTTMHTPHGSRNGAAVAPSCPRGALAAGHVAAARWLLLRGAKASAWVVRAGLGPLGPHSPSLASPCAPASAPAPPALAAAPPHGSMAAAAAQPGGHADTAAARAEEGACSGGRRERFHRSESITEGGEGEEGEATEGVRGTEECGSINWEASRQQVEVRACSKAGNGVHRDVQRLLHADMHSAAPTPPPWPMGLFRSSSVPGPSTVTRASPSLIASSSSFSSSSSSVRRPPSLLFARASSVPGSTRRVSFRRHTHTTGGHGGQAGRRRHNEGKSSRGAGSSGARDEVVLGGRERGAGGADAGRREGEEAGMGGVAVRSGECGAAGGGGEACAASEAPDYAAYAPFPHSLSSSSSSSSSARLRSLFRATCTLSATPTSPASPADTASPAMPPRSDGRGGRGGRAYEVVPVDWLQEVEARRARMSGGEAGEGGGRGSLDSQMRRAAGAVTGDHHARGSHSARASGASDATRPAARPTGPSRKAACEPLCTTACAPGFSDQSSPLCNSTPALTPTTPATATTATAPISVPSTDSAPSSACSFSPHTPPAAAPADSPFPAAATARCNCSHAQHLEPHLAAPCERACSALQHGQPTAAAHEKGAAKETISGLTNGAQHHMHPPHLTILTPHSACSATSTPTPSHTTPAPPATTTPASMHQWRRRRRREWRGRDDSDSVRRMNASLAYLSVQHSHLVHLGAADDDDDGLDVDEMVVGARLDAAAERGEFGGECSEGWQEEEMGWVECMGSAAGDASSVYDRYSGPLTHAALAAAGVITSTAAAAAALPSGAPSSFHSSPNRAAPPSVSSHTSTPAAMSPACLSPHAHPSAHSPCRSTSHGSPSASLPRVPCSLSHGSCDSSAGSGASEGRRRSMLGMSRSMGVATLSHALSSLTHAAAVSSGSISGSPAAARPASRLMLSSGPTPDAQHTCGNGSTSLGSGAGTGAGAGAGRGMGAEAETEGDMGLDIDILLSDLRSRQMRSTSGPLAPRMAGPLRSVTHPAAGMAAAAAAAVASVGEIGGEDRSAPLCDVGVDAWRSAAEADSGDHSLAA